MSTEPKEADRLATLHRTGLLDSEPSESFDRVTRLAARTLDAPMVLVSLVDTTRQWFKSQYGCALQESARDISFCTHTVSRRQPLIVPDATLDVRFASSPLVTQTPFIRAYLGIPLFAQDGHAVGALCALDPRPREFGNDDVAVLSDFARIVEDAIHALEAVVQGNTSQQYDLQAEVARQTKQMQVANDALRSHVKRLVESERAARAARQRTRSIADGLPVMIGYWNRHLRLEFANEKYHRWFGIPLEKIIGMSMPDLMGVLYAGAEPYVRRALEGKAQRYERYGMARPSDGVQVSMEIRFIPDLDDAAEVRGFTSLVTDITDYRAGQARPDAPAVPARE